MNPMQTRLTQTRETGRHSFTLIELLVVISIITILASLLLPVMARTRMVAVTTNCLNNIKQYRLGAELYRDDHEGILPSQWRWDGCFTQRKKGKCTGTWAPVEYVNGYGARQVYKAWRLPCSTAQELFADRLATNPYQRENIWKVYVQNMKNLVEGMNCKGIRGPDFKPGYPKKFQLYFNLETLVNPEKAVLLHETWMPVKALQEGSNGYFPVNCHEMGRVVAYADGHGKIAREMKVFHYKQWRPYLYAGTKWQTKYPLP
ncbi:MAG: type II secretion system protein [Lentisphaerae bacterium]|nr:MAG: type II secretion system protein [Lentisphaerota bacterium]